MTRKLYGMGFAAALLAVGSGGLAIAQTSCARPPIAHGQIAGAPPRVSVLTYNVHGLPWLAASTDRADDLRAIGSRLAALHRSGNAPQITVIQEAFTQQARLLATTSGYRYAAFGPGEKVTTTASITPALALDLDLGAHWWKGEGLGKWEGSGLMLLSDYPIVRVRRMSFSPAACAGFDCLAAKGALLAEIDLPGGRRIEIATAHLNSRHASGVSSARSNRAWSIEVDQLIQFVATQRDPGLPLILAGDFNVGKDLQRQGAFARIAQTLDPTASDGLRSLVRSGAVLDADAAIELNRGKDWEIALAGGTQRLNPETVSVPFGRNGGMPLSDHLGYAINFSLDCDNSGMIRNERIDSQPAKAFTL